MGRIGEKFVLNQIINDFLREEVLNGDNSADVNIQDQKTRAFDLPFHQTLGTTTLAVDLAAEDYSFTASPGHSISAGEDIALYDVVAEQGFAGTVLVVTDDVIDIDVPASCSCAAASTIVSRSTIDMNVNGAVTRQTFNITNPFETPEHITRIMFMMQLDSAPTLPKFGDLTALTRGLVFRAVNSEVVNYFNVKSNAELALTMYDLNFYTVAGVGQDGLAGRYTFAGPEKHGVVIELRQGESLEMIVQDDLTDLASFKILAQGHESGGE